MAVVATPALPAGRRAGSGRRTLLRRGLAVWHLYLFLVPTFVFVLVFEYYPALSAIFHAFTDWNGAGVWRWTGLENFQQLVQDPAIRIATANMLVLLAWRVVRTLTIPLFFAELIFNFPGQRAQFWFRFLLIIPLVIPTVVESLVWRFFLGPPPIGVVNAVLADAGLGWLQRGWLGDAAVALYALMFTGFPWVMPVAMLIYYAGLQAIPDTILDAARIDGASTLRRILAVDVPLVAGQMKLLLILNIIGGIQDFAWILIITDGGPGYATMVPALYMYDQAFRSGQFGYGSAIGLVLFLVIFAVTLLNNRFLRSSIEYDA
jgi:raffinose/stachyose/melibiose transport system permease protein